MADEIYVLGVTETNINLITKISEKDKIDAVKLYSNMNESSETKKNFFEHLMENLSKKSGKNEEKEFKTIDDFK
jgi:flagellar biogenesis protein FliO